MDMSRRRSTPSPRFAPYRKRKMSMSVSVSPTRGTRRAHDASHRRGHTRALSTREIPPRSPDRALGSRRGEAQPSRTACSAEVENHSLARTGGERAVSRTRRHTTTDGSSRGQPSHASALSTYADLPGPFLRLPLTSAPPPSAAGQKMPEPPALVDSFLRSIELPYHPSSVPPPQTSSSLTPPSLRLPTSSTEPANKVASTNANGHHVSLVYKGYPFTYDLSTLPDDPTGTIALLTITKSDPGAYLLVGAHYRRTGRSRAACSVIRSLLDNLDSASDVGKAKGDAPSPASQSSSGTSAFPGSPCPEPIDLTIPVFNSAAMRPAMLLLAACELDVSREHPEGPESIRHASTAHDLFRAVYGTVNDAIVAGAARPQPRNSLGLEFSSNRYCVSLPPLDSSSNVPSNAPLPLVESSARVRDLEQELGAAREDQKKLQEKLTASNEHLTRAEDKVHALESRSRDLLVQLDASRDENWALRQLLAEAEQKAREPAQCAPGAESRVWGRLKDLLFDNLGGGARGE